MTACTILRTAEVIQTSLPPLVHQYRIVKSCSCLCLRLYRQEYHHTASSQCMILVRSLVLFLLYYPQKFISGPTRSAGYKLRHKTASTNSTMNSYFSRRPRLWNSLPIIDLTQSFQTIKFKLKKLFLESLCKQFQQ